MSLGLSLDWLANLLPGERLLLAALGSPGAVPALSSHFVRAAGLLTLSGALLHLRRSHQHAALQHQQELALRQELLAYLAFAGSSRPLRASEDAFQNASDLGRQLSRLIARRSSFGRAALLLRGAGNLLTVAGSAGFDDLSVEALNRWGRSVSGPSLGPELALAGSAVGPSPITSSSFTLRLNRRRTERSPLSSMSCRDVHIVPLSTAQGLLGALVVSTQTRPVSHFGPVCPQDPEPSWPLEVAASLPLADRLQPLQMLASRLARPETLTANGPLSHGKLVSIELPADRSADMSPFARPKPREPLSEEGLFEYAVGSLARRMRSVRDLRRLMAPRAEPGESGQQSIDRVLQRLEDLRYLSDDRFAADFTRLRKENQSHGRRRVQQDLAAKGIAKDLVTSTIAHAFDDTDEVALARRYAERKRIKPPGNEKETARVLGRLLRAGFASTAVWKLLRSWKVDLDEIEVHLPEVAD